MAKRSPAPRLAAPGPPRNQVVQCSCGVSLQHAVEVDLAVLDRSSACRSGPRRPCWSAPPAVCRTSSGRGFPAGGCRGPGSTWRAAWRRQVAFRTRRGRLPLPLPLPLDRCRWTVAVGRCRWRGCCPRRCRWSPLCDGSAAWRSWHRCRCWPGRSTRGPVRLARPGGRRRRRSSRAAESLPDRCSRRSWSASKVTLHIAPTLP